MLMWYLVLAFRRDWRVSVAGGRQPFLMLSSGCVSPVSQTWPPENRVYLVRIQRDRERMDCYLATSRLCLDLYIL